LIVVLCWCMGKKKKSYIIENLREIIFGFEDSLVSTLGAITGIAAGAGSTFVVVLSGLVLIAVEAMSMSAGSYLSSKSVADAKRALDSRKNKKETDSTHPIRGGFIMGIFYFIGGFVPLTPYFFLSIKQAYAPSIIATATVLFLLGAWNAGFAKRARWKGGLEMMIISLGAAGLGYLIGLIVSVAFGVEVGA